MISIQHIFILGFLALPVLLTAFFMRREDATVYAIFGLVTVHLISALLCQSFGVFSLETAILTQATYTVFVGSLAWFRRVQNRVPFSWTWAYVLLVAFACMYTVHYWYSGDMMQHGGGGYISVSHATLVHPYFPDEWYSIAHARQAIESGTLPITNPFQKNDATFSNLQFGFHALVAEFLILFGDAQVESYVWFTIFQTSLIALLVSVIVTNFGAPNIVAALAGVTILYIPSVANLPGLWTLIPFTSGILIFLFGVYGMVRKIRWLVWGNLVALVFVYPPLVLWYILGAAVFEWSVFQQKDRENKKIFLEYAASLMVAAVLLLVTGYGLEFLSTGLQRLAFTSFLGSVQPIFSPIGVVPWWALVFVPVGVLVALRGRELYLLTLSITGLVLWLWYSMSDTRFIIGYERVVIITSIMLIILGALGAGHLINNVKRSQFDNKVFFAMVLGAVLFVLMIPQYTNVHDWRRFVAVNEQAGVLLVPEAPANDYYDSSIISIAKSMEGDFFLASPWQSTIVASLTKHQPLVLQPGTHVLDRQLYDIFMGADCPTKEDLLRKSSIRFVVSPYPIDCQQFDLRGRAAKGGYVYKGQ